MQNKNTESCPLCNNTAAPFYKNEFFFCTGCMAVFRSRQLFLTPGEERARYEAHNNDIHDLGYQEFVSPITTSVLKNFRPENKGLDFGAGTGPVISKLLKDKDYNIKQYDPFFHNYPELLEKKYDYVVCCEVMEHFHNPQKEFSLLKQLLQPAGCLYCMTHIYSTKINFDSWYYKNDPTHVFIYQKETLEWIKTKFGFSSLAIANRLIAFKN